MGIDEIKKRDIVLTVNDTGRHFGISPLFMSTCCGHFHTPKMTPVSFPKYMLLTLAHEQIFIIYGGRYE